MAASAWICALAGHPAGLQLALGGNSGHAGRVGPSAQCGGRPHAEQQAGGKAALSATSSDPVKRRPSGERAVEKVGNEKARVDIACAEQAGLA